MPNRSQNVRRTKNPRILIVTPEITYLPAGMGNMSNRLRAKAGGLADVSASLVGALYKQGADVHVALPHYRKLFHVDTGSLIDKELRNYVSHLSHNRVHLAEDRIFYYRDTVYSNYTDDSLAMALAFQREVINNIIPSVNPDLIHCNDWMTGLIPAAARRLGIPCLFTVHNIHTHKVTMDVIEDRGIDAAEFFRYLYFDRPPVTYYESRCSNPVDMLASGIFAAHFINTVSPTFLQEMVNYQHSFVPEEVRREIIAKVHASCASGILNSPDPDSDPAIDPELPEHYDESNFHFVKRKLKVEFQQKTGLRMNPDAPVFFWPSRLDPVQKGCQLVTDILYRMLDKYHNDGLQVAVVANGSYQKYFRQIREMHHLYDNLTVCDFDSGLSKLGFAASDFMMMPSLFEPCGLPQMECQKYGSLPVVRDTGGLHDTVEMLDVAGGNGNGFVFETFDSNGLFWAVDRAMDFYRLPVEIKNREIARIMKEAKARFTHEVTARQYMDTYESMLHRPLVK